MLKKFTVSKRRWARGDGSTGLLHDPITKKMCVLGFWLRQIHKKRVCEITGKRHPAEIGVMELYNLGSQGLAEEFNDSYLYWIDDERIFHLEELFKEAGYKMEVVE